MSFASNAVMAKARAMYASHITAAEYEALAASKTLPELLSKLEKNRHFAPALERAHRDIGPAQAEELLRISIFDRLSVLSRYAISGNADFYKYYIAKNDIAQLARLIRLLLCDRLQDYLAVLPPFYEKLTQLDLYALASAGSFADILRILSGTPYRAVLMPFARRMNEPDVYLRIETALNAYLSEYLSDALRRDKSDRKQVDEVVRLFFDSRFITSLYRLKKIGVRDEQITRGYLMGGCTAFSKKQAEALIAAADEKEFMQALSPTVYGDPLRGLDFGDTEKVMEDYLCRKLTRGLRYYDDPAAIMICYMLLAEFEVKNVVRIIEGIRYGVDPEQIRKSLTGFSAA
ncbi:MAG: V-type ATPase subunit [Clostridia bacterium]|nr:V-type ATPase subunit [Clostridia bacterium]